MFDGGHHLPFPVSIGHEFIAEVTEVGSEVDWLQPGEVVTSDLNYRCGACDQCRAQRSHLCREGQVGRFSNRGFADLGDLHASYLVSLGHDARRHLALAEPLSCVLHAKRWAALEPDDRVLVIGAGGIGLCMAFALTMQPPVTTFDFSETMPARRGLLEGAVGGNARGLAEPDGEYDVVFDVSGTEPGLRAACGHVRPGGRLCSMSHIGESGAAGFLYSDIMRLDVTFTVSYLNGERTTLHEAAALLAEEWDAGWDALIEEVPFDQLARTFETRRSTPFCKTIVRIAGSSSGGPSVRA